MINEHLHWFKRANVSETKLRNSRGPHVERTSLVDPRFHEPLLFNGHVMYGQEAYPQATAYEGQHQAHNVAFSDLVDF